MFTADTCGELQSRE